ncbi:MAG: hypothetical protein SOI44_00455 [Lactimicrobium sp.]|jgi:uncharacterized protein YijF (DUF1287 family)|uniref:hypothetical protein n=1 Tax=Lactimicrobium sp. TaxID=2563780 RepID=UPI002F354F06
MTIFLATAAIVLSVVLAFCVALQQRMIEDLDRMVKINSERVKMTQDDRNRDHTDLSNLKANYDSTHRLALQAYYDVQTIINAPVEGEHAEDSSNDQI